MTQFARKLETPAGSWHNHLPAWIRSDPGYARLRPQFRQTLQAIANACNRPDEDGSMTGAFGGQSLINAAGCGRSTFWRHVARLEQLGYAVTLKRGGTIGSKNYGNVYGVPGKRGALHDRRCSRRMQRMVPSADGTLKPEIIEPGDQPQLWPGTPGTPGTPGSSGPPGKPPARRSDAERARRSAPAGAAAPQSRAESETGVVSKWDGGSPKVRHHHPPPHLPIWKNQSGAGASRPRSAPTEPRLADITLADLTSISRLLELHRQAVERRWVTASDADRLRFVAAAVRALRLGDHPPKLFRATVERRLWLWISTADEDEARRRIHRHDHGDPRRVPEAAASPKPTPPPPAPAVTLSDNAKLVRAAIALAKGRGRGSDPFRLAQLSGMTQERWDEALAEIETTQNTKASE